MNQKTSAHLFSCQCIWATKLYSGKSPTSPRSKWSLSGSMSFNICSSHSVQLSLSIKTKRFRNRPLPPNLVNLGHKVNWINKIRVEEMSPLVLSKDLSKCLTLVITFRTNDSMKSNNHSSECSQFRNNHGKTKITIVKLKNSKILFRSPARNVVHWFTSTVWS